MLRADRVRGEQKVDRCVGELKVARRKLGSLLYGTPQSAGRGRTRQHEPHREFCALSLVCVHVPHDTTDTHTPHTLLPLLSQRTPTRAAQQGPLGDTQSPRMSKHLLDLVRVHQLALLAFVLLSWVSRCQHHLQSQAQRAWPACVVRRLPHLLCVVHRCGTR